jgi:hypothetical protein
MLLQQWRRQRRSSKSWVLGLMMVQAAVQQMAMLLQSQHMTGMGQLPMLRQQGAAARPAAGVHLQQW